MSDENVSEIDIVIDELVSSGLSDHQTKLVNDLIRYTYAHIHRSNIQINRSKQLANEAIESSRLLSLYYLPVTSSVQ